MALAGIVFPLVPALLALYLLQRTADRRRIGFDLRRPGFDAGWGFALAAGIGIPGWRCTSVPARSGSTPTSRRPTWPRPWTVPVLIGAALMNSVLEEVVMIGFWFTRGRQSGWPIWVVVVGSALVRGSYHLYQGFGGFVGNAIMGDLRPGLPEVQTGRALGVCPFPARPRRSRRLLPGSPVRRLALAPRPPPPPPPSSTPPFRSNACALAQGFDRSGEVFGGVGRESGALG